MYMFFFLGVTQVDLLLKHYASKELLPFIFHIGQCGYIETKFDCQNTFYMHNGYSDLNSQGLIL